MKDCTKKRMHFSWLKNAIAGFLIILINSYTVHAQVELISPTGDGGFENGTTFAANGWTSVSDGTNYWVVGNLAPAYAGAQGTHVSKNGANYNYGTGTARTSHFYKDVVIPTGATAITLSFYWKSGGELNFDRSLIYTAPTTVSPIAAVPASSSTTLTGATLVWTQPSVQSPLVYTLATITLPNSLAGTTVRIIFTWQNDGSSGSSIGTAIDNISLTYVEATPCSGTPTGGTTAATVTSGCSGYTSALSVSGSSSDGGISYQWESSPTGSSPWTPIVGATSATYTATVTSDIYYHRITTCSNSGLSASSTDIHLNMSPCYIMSNSTVTACSGTFYDSGGSGSNYSASENYTMTICANTGQYPQINFTSFSTESLTYDWLKIYDGNSTSAPLLGTWGGSTSPGTIIGSNTCLTYQFKSDGSSQYAGWAATISCISPCSGTPTGGTSAATVTTGCSGYTSVLSVTGASTEPGLTYQWESSPTGSAPWTTVAGATAANYTAIVTSDIYYHRIIKCSNSGLSATSTDVHLNMSPCYIMSNSTVTACSGTFYDSGGSGSNYSASENYTMTICANSGQFPQISFTSFTTESSLDWLKIYDGNSTSAPLLGTWSGSTSPGIINGNYSCLTYQFHSDGSVQNAGWAATISCVSGCSGTPTGGTTAATVSTGCSGYTSVLSVTGATTDPGLTYQWESSPTGSAPWTPVVGATLASYTATVTSDIYYHRITTCSNSGLSSNSVAVHLNVTCYTMSNSTITACSGTFYDSGGSGSNYSASENYTMTICANSGQYPQISFSSFTTESTSIDWLKIYDGNSTAAPLLGTWSGSTSPGTLIGSNTCLTYQFHSDGSLQYVGVGSNNFMPFTMFRNSNWWICNCNCNNGLFGIYKCDKCNRCFTRCWFNLSVGILANWHSTLDCNSRCNWTHLYSNCNF
jgi:hypothetical protein